MYEVVRVSLATSIQEPLTPARPGVVEVPRDSTPAGTNISWKSAEITTWKETLGYNGNHWLQFCWLHIYQLLFSHPIGSGLFDYISTYYSSVGENTIGYI